MGLAGVKVKQRFGLDPRNTNWSNDKSRFGHQYLEKMGWQPGSGLGLVDHAVTSHVKVSVKDDNLGLGAKLKKKSSDPLDDDETHGLDAFQRILGRLNGKEDKIDRELERQRKDKIINGKLGIQFVKGDTLKSTWDSESKQLRGDGSKKDNARSSKKRSRHDDEDNKEPAVEEKKKKKKENKEKKSKDKKASKKEKESRKKEKESGKKENEVKQVKESGKSGKKERKDKKNAKEEKKERKNIESKSAILKNEAPMASRLSARAKYIRQKKASVMDPKLLNEIFMITKKTHE